MRTVRLSWPAMAIVLLALFSCLGALVVDADRVNFEVKLDPGAMEQRRKWEEWCRLRKQMARLRHWKRDIREADLSKLLYPDIQDSSVEAVLFPESQDTSVKSRPEGTYML